MTPPDAVWTGLLAEAAEWHLLSLLLSRPAGAWHDRVRSLAGDVRDPSLASLARAALDEADEGCYLTLLGPGGDVSPREVGYREVADPGRVLADLVAYHQAFAWKRGEEPPDHVASETGFVAYLKLKQACALRCDDAEAAEVTAQAARGFVETHLATFAEPLAHGLAVAGAGYLVGAGAALLERVGPRPETTEGGWVPEGLEGCGFGCAALATDDTGA